MQLIGGVDRYEDFRTYLLPLLLSILITTLFIVVSSPALVLL